MTVVPEAGTLGLPPSSGWVLSAMLCRCDWSGLKVLGVGELCVFVEGNIAKYVWWRITSRSRWTKTNCTYPEEHRSKGSRPSGESRGKGDLLAKGKASKGSQI